MKKIAIAAGAIAVVIGSAVGYRMVTGRCPVGDLCSYIHGAPAQHAPVVP